VRSFTSIWTPEQAGQQLLFRDPEEDKLKRLDEVVDKIHDRYGKRAMHRGIPTEEDTGAVT